MCPFHVCMKVHLNNICIYDKCNSTVRLSNNRCTYTVLKVFIKSLPFPTTIKFWKSGPKCLSNPEICA